MNLKLGGLQETSLLDYPGKICAIVWTVGCNFRCPFCYNPNMVYGKTENIPIDHVLSFLNKRKGKLDALSITGGEPLVYEDLDLFIRKVKNLGFLVKIDTNGTFPHRLKPLLDENLVDYVSMDLKAPFKKYDQLAGVQVDTDQIKKSIKLIMNTAQDYEFKTTVIPGLLEKKDIKTIASMIKGAKRYYLQQFKIDVPVINNELLAVTKPYKKHDFEEMKKHASSLVKSCLLRGV
jgi:pyruvate formate lyase activating enzyme